MSQLFNRFGSFAWLWRTVDEPAPSGWTPIFYKTLAVNMAETTVKTRHRRWLRLG